MRFREVRWPCSYPVEVTLPQGRMAAVVENVGETGARLAGLPKVAPGIRIVLHYLGRRAEGQVSWYRDGQCGISFMWRLSAADVAVIRRAPGMVTVPRRMGGHGFREL